MPKSLHLNDVTVINTAPSILGAKGQDILVDNRTINTIELACQVNNVFA
jgi:hypothetical protein